MNEQEKAERYAREKLGNWCHIVHSAYEISQCTNGEVTVNDYLAGYNEAKRWIPISERLPEILVDEKINAVLCKPDGGFPFVGYYTGNKSEFNISGTQTVKHVIEWREI